MLNFTIYINSTALTGAASGGNCRNAAQQVLNQNFLGTYSLAVNADQTSKQSTSSDARVIATAYIALRLRDPRTISSLVEIEGLTPLSLTLSAETMETASISEQIGGFSYTLGLYHPNLTSDATFVVDSNRYYRWATAMYANQLWFTNPLNTLRVTDGAVVKKPRNVPAARYMTWFFDHCFMGWPTWKGAERPTLLMWSHLYDYKQWKTEHKNEADEFDFVDWVDSTLPIKGLTGIGALQDTLYVFTPTAIIPGKYVGLPKIMQFGPAIEPCGNGLRYGLARTQQAFYFWNSVENNFFSFDGQELKPIGGPIRSYILQTVHTNFVYQQMTYAIVRPEYQEIEWVFVSSAQTSPTFDKAVVYNYRSNSWYTKDVANYHCFGSSTGKRAGNMLDIVDTDGDPIACKDLTGTAEDLNLLPESFQVPNLYGRTRGAIAMEITSQAALTGGTQIPLGTNTTYLETRDFTSNYQNVMEVNSITLHCGGVYTTVDVYLSTRNNIQDAVTFTKVGSWTNTLTEGRLTFPCVSGKIFRWKFVPVATPVANRVGFFSFSAYVDNLYNRQAAK